MYTLQQIQDIIDATPAKFKGRRIKEFEPRCLCMGRKRRNDCDRKMWTIFDVWGQEFACRVVVAGGIIQ